MAGACRLTAPGTCLHDEFDLDALPLFLHTWQKGSRSHDSKLDELFEHIKQLQCYPLPAGLWESDVFPARMQPYQPYELDQIFQQSELHWLGQETKKIAFCFDTDLDLYPSLK